MTPQTISPQELYKLHQNRERLDLIDVRTPVEFREAHATMARNVPLDSLDPTKIMEARQTSQGEPLYVICQAGKRAATACEQFHQQGFENVVNVQGGTEAWAAAGLPITRGKKAVSLERQVRIVAGLLVFLGSMLGVLVHPYFVWLSALVGAGLVFAGVTDTCGMGMLLARMPWNHCKSDCSV